MPAAKTAQPALNSPKKTAKTGAASKSPKKAAKKVTLDDVWATIDRIGKAHEETEKAHRVAIDEVTKAHGETEKALKETQAAVKETQRIVGDLGNRFGDMAERMLIPDLVDKFERFGFSFGKLSHNVRWKKKEYDLSMELDALLENGKEAMVVEVKAKLDKEDVNEQMGRMEKVRRYADLDGDKRHFFAAMAAMTASEKAIDYALAKGFYVIMPSGEDVKITRPTAEPRVW
ncbi:MAG: hypothetical protein LBU00_03190 [Treponema sp.]|jgi:hypothetical protein|nr:hypothetical protein [Treponema sp.]